MANEAVKERNMELALRTAFELFLDHGVENTTKEMIVRKSGLSRSSVDRYFPDKVTCVLAVAHWAGRNVREKYFSMSSIIDNLSLSGAEMLEKYLKDVQSLMYNDPSYFVLGVECRIFIYRNAVNNKTALEELFVSLGSSDLLKKIFDRGIADGSITAEIDPETEVIIVREALIGFLASIALSFNRSIAGDRSLSEHYIKQILKRYGI